MHQITDQPRDRPSRPLDPEEREKHVVLNVVMPSAGHMKDLQTFVDGLFTFIDSLSKVHLRPETKSKLKKIREGLDKDLKADAEKDKKEEVTCFRSADIYFVDEAIFRWNKPSRIVRLQRRRLKKRGLPNLALLNNARFEFIPHVLSHPKLTIFFIDVSIWKKRRKGRCVVLKVEWFRSKEEGGR